MHYNLLKKREQELEKQKKSLEKQLKKMPKGTLYCSKNGKYYRWDLYFDKKNRKVISKKNPKLAEKMAMKRYLQCQLEDAGKELKAIRAYMKSYMKERETLKLLSNPEYARLLKTYFRPLNEELAEWSQASYEKNKEHPEHLVHETMPGEYVRSKSEALIYMVLRSKGIPFHYEEKLQLSNRVIYPDFTIRHPKTGKIYYWEHFGLMNDPSYCKSVGSKIQLYSINGIIPTIQLITTYETAENPLTIAKIEKIVEEFFQ